MAEAIQLNAMKRNGNTARAERRAGRIPAIIYGGEGTTESITVDANAFRKLLGQAGIMRQLIALDVDGKTNDVLARDIQFHPVSETPQHIDFLRVSKTSTVAVMIAVQFINEGDSPGLKSGGVLNIVRHEIELNCPATQIPEQITIDLTGYNIGDSIHISAVTLPEGVEPTITDRDFTIATIAAPTIEVEEVETPEEGEEGAEGEEAAEGDKAEEGKGDGKAKADSKTDDKGKDKGKADSKADDKGKDK